MINLFAFQTPYFAYPLKKKKLQLEECSLVVLPKQASTTKLSFSIRPRKAFSNFEGPKRVIGIYLELGLLEMAKLLKKRRQGSPFPFYFLFYIQMVIVRPTHQTPVEVARHKLSTLSKR